MLVPRISSPSLTSMASSSPRRHGQSKSRKSGGTSLRKVPRVALLVETSQSFGRKLLCGIAQYLRENNPWMVFFTERAVCDGVPEWLKKWSGDGIISRINTPDVTKVLANINIPIIDLNEKLRGMGVPLISNDHDAMGQMAARHLLERGFVHFGFIGHNGLYWSDRRRDAFFHTVREAGGTCKNFSCHGKAPQRFLDHSWELEMESIIRWVQKLPRPTGIMTCDDFRGLQLLEACAIADVAVPQEVAVISVGDDDVACELANPPLSSIQLNAYRMGYEAAAQLDRLMRGEAAAPVELLIPPLDVATRQSTDIMAIDDPLVAKAMQFIHLHACNGINIDDVLRHMLVSRTTLQDRFRKTLNMSIHDVIIGVRIKRTKELLAETELPLSLIADRTGFKHVEYLSTAFKKLTGWTPVKYREEHGQKHRLKISQCFSPLPGSGSP
jgi:LacI family transcriptional regulator